MSETVQQVGKCPANELLSAMPDKALITESYLVRRVQDWLEDLRNGNHRAWPLAVREAIEWYVLPAVMEGVVASTGVGYRRTGS